MHNDGIEEIRHRKEDQCPPGTHSDVPIIEGSQTTGLVCMICGRAVRENMEYSSLVATEKGLVDIRPPERRPLE